MHALNEQITNSYYIGIFRSPAADSADRVQAAEKPLAQLEEKYREFFKTYCVECHNADTQQGKLRLDDISFTLDSVKCRTSGRRS